MVGCRLLPEGIIEDILLKLPTKSIIRFKSVSKSWLNLIKSSYFVNKHRLKCDDSYLATFFMARPTPRVERRFLTNFMICLDDEYKKPSHPLSQVGINTSPVLNFELPLSYDRRTCLNLVGHCNGIMCLMIDSSILLLINPLLNEVKTLPISPVDNSVSCLKLVGFGLDSVTMDFKVVRTFGSPQSVNEVNRYHRAEVYNLRTNAWRGLNKFPLIADHSSNASTFFNGVVHWCARSEYLEDWRMLTFNMASELFEHVEFPQGWNNDGSRYCDDIVPNVFIMNQESLAFTFVSYFGIVNIWTMKKHGNGVAWTKLYSIGPLVTLVSPIGFPKKNEFIFSSNKLKLILRDLPNLGRRFVICDVVSQLRAYDLHGRWSAIGLYRPSLVSINV